MLLFFAWTYFMKPSEEELRKAKEKQEAVLQQDTVINTRLTTADTLQSASASDIPNDSASVSSENKVRFGSFAAAASGNEENPVLENENIKVTFSSKGGKIKEVLLKHHYKTVTDSSHNESKELIKMLNQPGNRF
ncbi:MAG TPA: hypothetical protein PK611_07575, partial [Saprospiraceae bacterium]|nr:hypothetical protein [Saprospiraceae bacterium]